MLKWAERKEDMPKSYVIRAKLAEDKRTYRDIRIGSSVSLKVLAEAIISAFGFEFDHMCGFYEELGYHHDNKGRAYTMFADSPELGSESPRELSLSRHKIADLWKAERDTWQFVFDYGDDWRFLVMLTDIDEGDTPHPTVIKSVGDAPEQYPALAPRDEGEGEACDCDRCLDALFEEDLGINQPRPRGKLETMASLLLVLRNEDKHLLVLFNAPEVKEDDEDLMWVLVPQQHAVLEESVVYYCKEVLGVEPIRWSGMRPFTTSMGSENIVLAMPYVIDVATRDIKASEIFKAFEWLTLDELSLLPAASFAAPLMDDLYNMD
jgi:hypothetical protein